MTALIAEHRALADAIDGSQSEWACYRFAKKLREHKPLLDACLDRVADSLRAELSELGTDVAIDGSDLAAYANGQRFVRKGGPERERFSDADASWVTGARSAPGRRWVLRPQAPRRRVRPHWPPTRVGGPYRPHRRASPRPFATRRLEGARVRARHRRDGQGLRLRPVHDACAERNVLPIIARRRFVTEQPVEPPACEHGVWTFAGADFKRKATKWRCPTGECQPASKWVKADRRNPLVPRSSKRFGDLYRRRAAVECEFWALEERVQPIAASHPWHRASRATCRLDHACPPQLGARPSASRTARGLEPAVFPR